MERHAKVFGIGLSKTGTSSLDRALNDLGIRSIHYPCDPTTYEELVSGNYCLSVLNRYQAATDIPVAPFFPQLDEAYPGSKFILTVRDLDSWLASVEHHWAFMRQWAHRNRDFRRFSEFITACVYGTHYFHRERFAYVYRQHAWAVQNYFADRPDDLLVMDVCHGDGWDILCRFLGTSIPDRPFPHANRKEEKQERAKWIESLDIATLEFQQTVPVTANYILIDDYQLAGSTIADETRVRRLGERGGQSGDAPLDSATAVAELERMRREGAAFLVLAWPCFWWRDYYEDFWDYLKKSFRSVCDTERLTVFDLRATQRLPSQCPNKLEIEGGYGYSTDYYAVLRDGSRASAELVAPWIVKLLQPQNVVDVGCGTGEWAAAFKRHGVRHVLGIDGDYVDRNALAISSDEFLAADLTQPLAIERRFDLVVALEVAEHLPPEYASQFVHALTRLAPAVLFSAAIPHQGGEHHVNEQWPQYWVEHFNEHNFVAFDTLRVALWSNPAIQWWYSQNLLLYINRAHVSRYSRLPGEWLPSDSVPALVHPDCFLHRAWRSRVLEAMLELVKATPTGARILVADQAQFGAWPAVDRQIWPFTELDGVYNGPPRDSEEALWQLQRQRDSGAEFIAFAWPAFWWLDHYVDFAKHLRSSFPKILRTENWIAFALSPTLSDKG